MRYRSLIALLVIVLVPLFGESQTTTNLMVEAKAAMGEEQYKIALDATHEYATYARQQIQYLKEIKHLQNNKYNETTY